MAKVMLATGMLVAYGYTMEAFFAWYSANPYEGFMYKNRVEGPYWHTYYLLILCNCLAVQTFWSRRLRSSIPWLFFISIVVNVGMWLERYVIVITSLHRDFVPAAWNIYHGTFWDYATYYGTIGLFLSLMFLFIRFLPVISIAEMRELVLETQERAERQEASLGGAEAKAT
jgi:molybdopterin-containing oxidoreductase family membrane subunit